MPLPPRLRAVVGADGFRRVAACQGRLATTRSGRCCQPTASCCERPGGATLYLPPVDAAISNPLTGTLQVDAGGSGDFSAWSTALQDAVGNGETEAVLQLTSNRWAIDHDLPLAPADFVPQTLPNGCIRGFSLDRQLFPDGEPVGTPVGAYDGQYLILDGFGSIVDTVLLTGEPLYLQTVGLSALHPAWTGVPATPGTPRWALTLVYATQFIPFDIFALIPRVALTFEFGDYCQVNAAQAKSISVPSILPPNFSPPLVGPYYLADLGAGLDPATAVQPLPGPQTAIGGGDSLRWLLSASASRRDLQTNAFGNTGQAVYAASARVVVAVQHQSAGGLTDRFTACPDFPPLVEPCNPTGANACCENDADCGKVDPLAPYRWRRVRQAVGSVEDMDPAGVSSTAPGWIVVPSPVDDIVSMASGTPDCEISPATTVVSAGSASNTDRLGHQRILRLAGSTTISGDSVASNARVEPLTSAVGKSWRITLTQPIIWDRPASGVNTLLGILRIVAETPATAPTTAGTLLNITQAQFEWTDLPINPNLTDGLQGFTLDASVNPDPIEDVTPNVVGFAYYASTGENSCLRAVQLVPEIAFGLPSVLLDTTRFGWLTDSTSVTSPQTRRKIRIRYNASPYFELLNIGACPQAPIPIVGARPCRECRQDGGL